jgi:hypothetical protein
VKGDKKMNGKTYAQRAENAEYHAMLLYSLTARLAAEYEHSAEESIYPALQLSDIRSAAVDCLHYGDYALAAAGRARNKDQALLHAQNAGRCGKAAWAIYYSLISR